MKKFILLVSLLAVMSLSYSASVVPVEDAVKASKNFLSERIGSMEAQSMTITLAHTEYAQDGTPLYYRFQVGDKGYIIVSATDLATPVLAYSLEGNYNSKTDAEYFCNQYKNQLAYLNQNPQTALPGNNTWKHYLNDNFQIRPHKGAPAVEPLVTTQWTQETYYNTYCPTNSEASFETMDGRTPVGCVALTMANILYYYRYPAHGYGIVSYIPKEYDNDGHLVYTYPVQTVNYSTATYDYDAIANSLDEYDGELAKLIYHCGVSNRMSYGPTGSGCQSEDALSAMQDHYYFNQNAQFQKKTDVVIADSLLYLWINKAKAEIDAHRPIFFSGSSATAGGHAWIVDGYTTIENNTYFHVNWGWAGSGNGYFLINNQNTAGYGNFNNGNSESMMINLMPADSAAYAKPATSEKRLTASLGTISDGAGNVKYPQSSNRRWVIATPSATSYSLNFAKLKVASGDKVTIYNGGTEASGVKQEYSGDYLMAACSDYAAGVSGCVNGDFQGQTLPAGITVSSDSVLVTFTSTANSATDYGFVLNYKANNYSISKCADMSIINNQWHAILTDKNSNATGDDLYRAATSCKWQLRDPYTSGYTFVFNKFDLKAGDFVDFYNYDSQTTPTFIARYDNSNIPGEVFTINASKVLIHFVSDNWQQGKGFELEFYQIAGIDEESGLEDVNIYPNPATNMINVAITDAQAQNITATVVDMTGKTIYTDIFNHNGGEQTYQIPVTSLAKGIYFLNLQSKQGKTIHKFIVQ